MTNTTTGWIVFVAAFGMTIGLIGADMATARTYEDIKTVAFVGLVFQHLSVVIAAFIGGRLIPTGTKLGS
jgi:hypothetical protein